ncbi:MAG TPA: transcriptional regulator TrmB [Candidatus Magasanikbacteria bacterium]|nr:transcriptional regulator TrmB [Candidatus Magasanikbacteria bacterium]
MDIERVLNELGLQDKKAKVYMACLELGTAHASDIALRAGVQRTTVYEILDFLKQKGLINSTPKGHGTVFSAEPPEHLQKLLHDQERMLHKAMPELQSFFNAGKPRPKVRFYEGIEGVRTVFMDTLAAHENRLRAILSIADLHEFIGAQWFDEYTNERIASGKKLFVIRSESREVGGIYPSSTHDNRELRFAPRGMEFALTQYLYDNKVAIISTKKEGYGMIIESSDYYLTQSNLFDILWDISRITKRLD